MSTKTLFTNDLVQAVVDLARTVTKTFFSSSIFFCYTWHCFYVMNKGCILTYHIWCDGFITGTQSEINFCLEHKTEAALDLLWDLVIFQQTRMTHMKIEMSSWTQPSMGQNSMASRLITYVVRVSWCGNTESYYAVISYLFAVSVVAAWEE